MDVFRLKIIDSFWAIGRAKGKLKGLKAEHKSFKAKYCQAWSKNCLAMKPELQQMDEKIKKQSLLLES